MINLFYLLALLVFATLAVRIGGLRPFQARIPFYLIFFLYLGIFSYPLLWTDAPRWFLSFNLALFLVGEVWLLSGPLIAGLRKRAGDKAYLRDLKKEKGGLYEIVQATRMLSQSKLGALIAIERRDSLESWCDKGIRVDARISRELLFSVFTPPGALHDGAAVVQKDKLASCGVIVPLTQASRFPKELGTRHRAAVGFSEATDSICLVVSEESGTVSIADRGSLYYDIPFEKLPEVIERALRFQLHRTKSPFQTLDAVKA